VTDDLIGRLEEFCKYTEQNRSTSSHAYQVAGDVRLLLAVIQGNRLGHQEFLESADRGVAGWKRANTRQIETISRLQLELDTRNRQLKDEQHKLLEVRRLLREWGDKGPVTGTDADVVSQFKNRIADAAEGRGGQLMDKILEFLQRQGGRLMAHYDTSTQDWVVGVEFGRETPDSDMAGGAAYASNADLEVCVQDIRKQVGING
jgi:hypothetical protein